MDRTERVDQVERLDIVVKGRQTEVTDRFREHVKDKLGRLERLDSKAYRVDVEICHESNPRLAGSCDRVELTLRSRGPVVRAEAAAQDPYARARHRGGQARGAPAPGGGPSPHPPSAASRPRLAGSGRVAPAGRRSRRPRRRALRGDGRGSRRRTAAQPTGSKRTTSTHGRRPARRTRKGARRDPDDRSTMRCTGWSWWVTTSTCTATPRTGCRAWSTAAAATRTGCCDLRTPERGDRLDQPHPHKRVRQV